MTRSEKIMWIFFAATSFQLAFLQPYVVLVAEERTNLFSGVLCFLTLIVVVIFAKQGAIRLKSPEFLFSAALAMMAGVSCLVSLTPLSSTYRVFVLLASGLGGFWSARILLDSPANQRRFQWLGLFLLAGMVSLSLLGYLVSGDIARFLISHTAPLTNVMLLLSFAPLTLLTQKSRAWMVAGVILLGFGYITLCLSQRISVVFIPLIVLLAGAAWGAMRWKHLVLIFFGMALVTAFLHQHIIWHKLSANYPYYRVENFPFSWNIIKQHPWGGIGLRSPREAFLQKYHVTLSHVPKEKFAKDVSKIVSADNLLLTFMTGLGLPFTLTYCVAVGILLAKLLGMAFKPPSGLFFHPLVLLFPLTVALLHFQLFDGLLFPQSSWFFHILLGLIPFRRAVAEPAGMESPTKESLSCSADMPTG
jgi:hypothetical protein